MIYYVSFTGIKLKINNLRKKYLELINYEISYKHYETPCESRDFESSKASFNNGFKLSVCSLARYKIACN